MLCGFLAKERRTAGSGARPSTGSADDIRSGCGSRPPATTDLQGGDAGPSAQLRPATGRPTAALDRATEYGQPLCRPATVPSQRPQSRRTPGSASSPFCCAPALSTLPSSALISAARTPTGSCTSARRASRRRRRASGSSGRSAGRARSATTASTTTSSRSTPGTRRTTWRRRPATSTRGPSTPRSRALPAWARRSACPRRCSPSTSWRSPLGTLALALWLRARRYSPWFALLYAAYPGLIFCVVRDLTEPVAFALVALALLVFDAGAKLAHRCERGALRDRRADARDHAGVRRCGGPGSRAEGS